MPVKVPGTGEKQIQIDGEQSSPSRTQSMAEDTTERIWFYKRDTWQELSRVEGSKYPQRIRAQDNRPDIKA